MRLIYKHEHEGIWFSNNGHTAYMRGERPARLLPEGHGWEPTIQHHIARKRTFPRGDVQYTRELVMFYRRPGHV